MADYCRQRQCFQYFEQASVWQTCQIGLCFDAIFTKEVGTWTYWQIFTGNYIQKRNVTEQTYKIIFSIKSITNIGLPFDILISFVFVCVRIPVGKLMLLRLIPDSRVIGRTYNKNSAFFDVFFQMWQYYGQHFIDCINKSVQRLENVVRTCCAIA